MKLFDTLTDDMLGNNAKQLEQDVSDPNTMIINGEKVPFSPQQFEYQALKFDLFRYQFKNDKFKSVVRHIWELFQTTAAVPKKGSKRKKYNDSVRHILFNLYLGYRWNLPIYYSRNKNDFKKDSWYGMVFFTYDFFIKSVDTLINLGFIKNAIGIHFVDKGKPKQSRMWASPKLRKLFDQLLDSQIAERAEPANVIRLRSENKRDVDFKKQPYRYGLTIGEFSKMDANLRRYNAICKTQTVTLNLHNTNVTYDFYMKLSNWYSKGMIDIYEFSSLLNSNSIAYIMTQLYSYIHSSIGNMGSYKTIAHIEKRKAHNTRILNNKGNIYPLLRGNGGSALFKRLLHFYSPANKLKSRKANRLQNLGLHIKYNYLYRVFNNSKFKYGGRFYGSIVQSLPNHSANGYCHNLSALRSQIYINGNETVEKDYSSLHPRLIYNTYLKESCPKNFYEIDGFERGYVKYAVLVLLNETIKQNCKEAIPAIKEKLIDMGYKENLNHEYLSKLITAIKKKHFKILKWIGTGAGIELMRMDSDIMEDILINLMDQNIFAIPVHDSLIVEKQHEGALIKQMDESYFKLVGWHPVVK